MYIDYSTYFSAFSSIPNVCVCTFVSEGSFFSNYDKCIMAHLSLSPEYSPCHSHFPNSLQKFFFRLLLFWFCAGKSFQASLWSCNILLLISDPQKWHKITNFIFMFSIAKKRFISIHVPLRKQRINIQNTSNPNWPMAQSGRSTATSYHIHRCGCACT